MKVQVYHGFSSQTNRYGRFHMLANHNTGLCRCYDMNGPLGENAAGASL